MKESVNIFQSQREFHVFVANSFSDLRRLKKEGDLKAFNQLLLKTMPEVRRYVQKNLNRAVVKGKIDRNRYKADDIIDRFL